jgi:hypothetical protein
MAACRSSSSMNFFILVSKEAIVSDLITNSLPVDCVCINFVDDKIRLQSIIKRVILFGTGDLFLPSDLLKLEVASCISVHFFESSSNQVFLLTVNVKSKSFFAPQGFSQFTLKESRKSRHLRAL